jgi:hypothetical protein
MAEISQTKPARLYFQLGVQFALPENEVKNAPPEKHVDNSLHSALRDEIDARLPPEFDDVQLLGIEKMPECKSLYVAYFSVSKIHQFSLHEIRIQKKPSNQPTILKRPLLQARRSIEQTILSSLKTRYVIDALRLRYVTSRNFIFEIYFAGTLTVEKVFEPEEISQAGGIRCALDDFLDEMRCAIRESGLEGDASKAYRARNRKNHYVFEMDVACHYGFDETEVDGQMGLLNHPMSREEYERIGVFADDSAVEDLVPEVKSYYYDSLEQTLPPAVYLLEFDLDYMDHDDGLFDISEEICISYSGD